MALSSINGVAAPAVTIEASIAITATLRFIYRALRLGYIANAILCNTSISIMAAGPIDRLFLAHPRSAGQGYFEHLRFAWSFGATMAVGTVAALVHGLLPFICQTAAGDRIRALYARLATREPGAHGGATS